jgi:selenocysteine lyase/cysteine desulfurase
LDVDSCRRTVSKREIALVVLNHASNVNGVVQDLGGLGEVFRDIPVMIDAAQTVGVLPIDVRREGIDFLACSAHKGLLGPTGVGACYLAADREVEPLLEGGTGSRSESVDHPEFRPDRYEAGTLNLHGIAGTLGALEFLERRGLGGDNERRLTEMLLRGIRSVSGVRLQSPHDGSALCASFTIESLRPDEIAQTLEQQYGVLCRPGLQCAPAAHRHLRTFPQGTVRLSPGWMTQPEDIETAIRAVHAVARSK